MTGRSNGHINVPWSAKDALLGIAFVVGASVLIVGLLRLFYGDNGSRESTPLISPAIGLLVGLMVVTPWLFGIRRYDAPWSTLGFARPQARLSLLLPWLVLIVSLTFGGLYFVVVTAIGIDVLIPEPIPSSALGGGPVRAVNIVIIGILGPLAEEVFFRGFLLAALVPVLGGLRATAVCSAIFALNHGVVAVMVPAFGSGLLLSWLYLKTRSIWPTFMAHSAQNLIALLLAA